MLNAEDSVVWRDKVDAVKAHKVKITVYSVDGTFKWHVEQENWIECAHIIVTISVSPIEMIRRFCYTILSAREIFQSDGIGLRIAIFIDAKAQYE